MNQIESIDKILTARRQALGPDYNAYANHAKRVFLIAEQLGARNNRDEMAIAAAFHDVGIWTHESWDYLEPSNTEALKFIQENELMVNQELVESMIMNHHKITAVGNDLITEAFRKADLIDFSKHSIRYGLRKKWLKSLMDNYPWHNFHRVLVNKFLKYAWQNPLRPLPMMRW